MNEKIITLVENIEAKIIATVGDVNDRLTLRANILDLVTRHNRQQLINRLADRLFAERRAAGKKPK